ncbi:SGNH/GDSL hydrolase family protein [Micromonospora craniellae]|uniref:Inducer of phenazine A n=1 Tax=Micromonospora craniellae TaxID=2294034 RepID=A0A372G296_9ACTN|nr:Inducer of phenazine A [Micromonospora craniellae]QOC89921.1 Inducer of phenazine A [Micromonospora craniellae]RFS47068.1 Inducer of phenazine A [Micromonospora craniellae]
MKLQREILTPQMVQYDDFSSRGETQYLPYLMYFNRPDYRSEAINTDRLGFRISHGVDEQASVGSTLPDGPVRLLVGGSVPLGYGSTSDATTMASRLWTKHASSRPWLTYAGHCYNSTQELLLFLLYRHLLPPVEEIVILSGFNTLVMSRLVEMHRADQGPFYFCGEFFEQMEEVRARHRKTSRGFGRRAKPAVPSWPSPDEVRPELDDAIASAVDLVGRHLASWQVLAAATGARVSFVLQPMATWLRAEPAPEEKLIFDELDRISKLGTWDALYGDVSSVAAGQRYADALAPACERQGVRFVNLNPVLRAAVTDKSWLYVDRAHLTDEGNDIVAALLADQLGLS